MAHRSCIEVIWLVLAGRSELPHAAFLIRATVYSRRIACSPRRNTLVCGDAGRPSQAPGIDSYPAAMTLAVTHILTEVEQLSPGEQTELRRAIIERVPMSAELTEEDFASLAAHLLNESQS